MRIPRYIISCFFLATFKSLSLSLDFDNLIIKCIGTSLEGVNSRTSTRRSVWLCEGSWYAMTHNQTFCWCAIEKKSTQTQSRSKVVSESPAPWLCRYKMDWDPYWEASLNHTRHISFKVVWDPSLFFFLFLFFLSNVSVGRFLICSTNIKIKIFSRKSNHGIHIKLASSDLA